MFTLFAKRNCRLVSFTTESFVAVAYSARLPGFLSRTSPGGS
jgi:hypothetical protein